MCGITGWIDYERELENEVGILEQMTEVLAHRGPDAKGIWVKKHMAFGHRRLSVIDPEGGAQPMVKVRDGYNYVISYNGELYNTAEVRHELESEGYSFNTHSDTEVLLCAFMEWEEGCLARLNGIFAFAVWDEKRQRLFLARDRMGVKPLFYTKQHESFLFASELKALLRHPDVKPVINEEGLAEVLLLGPARTPGHGVFVGIHELRPAHYLIYDRKGVTIKRYWSLISSIHHDDLETTTEKVRFLLRDTVRRQLVSDVPVCTLLSGGLDSSAITALAAEVFAKEGKPPIHTYSIDYQDNEKYFQESVFQPNMDKPWIRRVSDYLGTCHHEIIVNMEQLVEGLHQATIAKDLPGMADIDSSLLFFCGKVKEGATVALSGECADEVFGGYPWFYKEEVMNREMFPWVNFLDARIELWNKEVFKSILPQEYIYRRYKESTAEMPRLEGESMLGERRRQLFYVNQNWFMNTLLDRKDRMSMGVGLEVRVPFSDHRLVEYVWNIPWEMKTVGGEAKGILRRALEGMLPKDVLHRVKSPYPKTHHPVYTSMVKTWLKEIMADKNAPIHQIVNNDRINELLNGTGDVFQYPFFGQLMRGPQMLAYIIQINIWLKEYSVRIK